MAFNRGILKNRNTEVEINYSRKNIVQPFFALERSASMIGTSGEFNKTHYVDGIGIQLRPIQDDTYNTSESTAGQDGAGGYGGMYSITQGAAPTQVIEKPYQRKQTGTGQNYDAGVSDGEGKRMQKQVSSGATWDIDLPGDKTAWPVPATPGPAPDNNEVDRLFIVTENHLPREKVYFKFFVPGSPLSMYDCVGGIMFTGPASNHGGSLGIGVYYIKLMGDGSALLFEADEATLTASVATWIWRDVWKWADPEKVVNHEHTITIHSDAIKDESAIGGLDWVGEHILFYSRAVTKQTEGDPNTTGNKNMNYWLQKSGGSKTATVEGSKFARTGSTYLYAAKNAHNRRAQHKTTVGPVKVDFRRDLRPYFAVGKASYPTSGDVTDQPFGLPFHPTTSGAKKLTVEVTGHIPTGCTLDIKVYDASTDVELSNAATTLSNSVVVQKTYDVTDQGRKYYTKIFFTGDGTNTPTVTLTRVLRDPVVETPTRTSITLPKIAGNPSNTELLQATIKKVTIQGQTQDPEQELATVEVTDYTDALSTIRTQGSQPIRITTEYDAVPNKTTLFEGFVRQGTIHKWGRDRVTGDDALALPVPDQRPYPDRQASHMVLTCESEARVLKETLNPDRFSWYDIDTGMPRKVSEIITILLKAAGYTDAEIDVPDSELRVWNSEYFTDVSEPVYEPIQSLVRDFFAGHFFWDPNAGASGMWRVEAQKVAPYNVLARFETQRASQVQSRTIGAHSNTYLDDQEGSWPTATVTSPKGNSQDIITTFIQRGTFTRWVEPPEGNLVFVVGGVSGACPDQTVEKTPRLLTQVAYNHESYNFLNVGTGDSRHPDETGSDYLGRIAPIHVYDPRLSCQEAVNWVARRVMDYSCHSRTHLQFRAPLILVTDADDANQTNPRPLRFYDVVEVYDDETATYDEYLVHSVSIEYTHDNVQMAQYHLVRSSIMGTKAAWFPKGYKRHMRSGMDATLEMIDPFAKGWANIRQVYANLAELYQLPDFEELFPFAGSDPFQEFDAGATFGDFGWMEGIDSWK